MRKFQAEYALFFQTHRSPANIAVHVASFAAVMLAFQSFIARWPTVAAAVNALYFASLCGMQGVPRTVLAATFMAQAASFWLSRAQSISAMACGAVFVAAYGLQDLSHIVTGEPTLQSLYSGGGAIQLGIEAAWHTYLQLPMLVQLLLE